MTEPPLPDLGQLPDLRKLAADKVSTGATYMTLDLGTPREGFRWIVRRICVSTPDPFTADSTTCVVWVGSRAPQDGTPEPTFTHLVLPVPTSLPNDAVWGDNQVVLVTGEHLLVTFKSSVNGTDYMAHAQIEEWRDSPPRLPVPPAPGPAPPAAPTPGR